MYRLLLTTLFLFCLRINVSAQIHADVAVSQGGSGLGTFRILLHHDKAPRTVANFIGLATGARNWIHPTEGHLMEDTPYYDGRIFHRLIHSFMIQGGCPLGTGTSGPGYVFQDEYDSSLTHSNRYVVSMANSGLNSNGSQFFITFDPTPHLDNLHSIFGEVINDATYPNSRDLIDDFTNPGSFPTGVNDRPLTDIRIDSVTISSDPPELLAGFDLDSAAWRLPVATETPVSLAYRSESNTMHLVWNATNRWDYPLFFTSQLTGSWSRVATLLSMEDSPNQEVDVTSLTTGTEPGFFSLPAVDYRPVPAAPAALAASNNVVEFYPEGGILTLTFFGGGGGSWIFLDSDSNLSNGLFGNFSFGGIDPSYFEPQSGLYIASGPSTHAGRLSIRKVLIQLDAPIGDNALTIFFTDLSFHTETTGWVEGGGWATAFDFNSAINQFPIRTPFTVTLAP